MKANKVDIIIPVYNVEPYLRRCLNRMLAQTYTHWRAICVDDGSTDGSPAILDEYAAKDSRFKVIHQENGGLSHARNEGLAVADAEYVMFVDSDDFIHPQTLELAVGLIERDDTDMVSWYRDSFYRNVQLKLMRRFKVNTDKAGAWRSPFKYRLGRIKTVVTDDARLVASERYWNDGITYGIMVDAYNVLLRCSMSEVTGDGVAMRVGSLPFDSRHFMTANHCVHHSGVERLKDGIFFLRFHRVAIALL